MIMMMMMVVNLYHVCIFFFFFAKGALRVGGLGTVWQINYDWDRIKFFE